MSCQLIISQNTWKISGKTISFGPTLRVALRFLWKKKREKSPPHIINVWKQRYLTSLQTALIPHYDFPKFSGKNQNSEIRWNSHLNNRCFCISFIIIQSGVAGILPSAKLKFMKMSRRAEQEIVMFNARRRTSLVSPTINVHSSWSWHAYAYDEQRSCTQAAFMQAN